MPNKSQTMRCKIKPLENTKPAGNIWNLGITERNLKYFESCIKSCNRRHRQGEWGNPHNCLVVNRLIGLPSVTRHEIGSVPP